MSGAQRESDPVNRTDLSVDAADYFGVLPEQTENADLFGLEPTDPSEDLYRVSYLFLSVFGNEDSPTDYGGMQLRAETTIYLDGDGSPPTRLTKIIQRTAHRAAHLFDSGIEEPEYGTGGRGWADPTYDAPETGNKYKKKGGYSGAGGGYLTGFDPVENAYDYQNWEVEPISGQEARTQGTIGKINWTTEIYNEVEETRYAELAGKASGIANPWTLTTTTEEGQDAVNVPPHKWRVGYEPSREDYVLRPPGRTDAASRYVSGAGQGKTVYVNGEKVGGLGPKGRVWINPEYQIGDGLSYRGNYSREGLVQETEATYQALRKGGVVYHVGETEEAVYLRTSRALPEGYRAADPDDVSPSLEVQDGRERRTIHLLGLIDPSDPLPVECWEDREVIDKLGKSDPRYRHSMSDEFRWPGYRDVRPVHIIQRDPDPDDGQAGLDDFGGDR
jgi:hypothetical protein